MTSPDDVGFEKLLRYLQETRGFDFGAYKKPSLTRRLAKRMQDVGASDYGTYIDMLDVEPGEFDFLFDTILINVTSFFRDLPSWEYLASEILPRIVTDEGSPVRLWVPGCASGEEVYTLAILLGEFLGIESLPDRVKLYATDVDDDALHAARQGRYTERDVAPIPEHYRSKYLEASGGHWAIRPDLRRAVIYGHHDLLTDPPLSRLDLLVCRNTLIYFNSEAQKRVLANMRFALKDTGFLFLGRAEMPLAQGELFHPISLQHRIFANVRAPGLDRVPPIAREGGVEGLTAGELRDSAFQASPIAQIVIDAKGNLADANSQARDSFGIRHEDIGRPFRDLEISFRPVELRSQIDEAAGTGAPLTIGGVERIGVDRSVQHFVVEVMPLRDRARQGIGIAIAFIDVTPTALSQAELASAKQHLDSAYEELHASSEALETTNEELQSANEELETSNEELQSTVEELETTNEELQATNEELETVNEELQSTNAELQAMNEELGQRDHLLNETQSFLESIIGSVRFGVVVLDTDLLVTRWDGRAEDIWGVAASEVIGKLLTDLDIGLPVRELSSLLTACLSGEVIGKSITLEGFNRRGKSVTSRLWAAPRRSNDQIEGIVLLIEERAIGNGPPEGSATG